jgi:hypothetical protein
MFSSTLLPHAQRALAILGKSGSLNDAYLAGGTALALHLGHRISVDFDFFTGNHFDFEKTRAALERVGNYQVDREEIDTMLGWFNDVRFSLFWYKYPLIGPEEYYEGIRIASKEDIAAMKLLAITTRAAKKDYIDLFFLQKVMSFEEMFGYFGQKFGVNQNRNFSVVKALQFFDDAEDSEMPRMIVQTDWEIVKRVLYQEATRLAKNLLGL